MVDNLSAEDKELLGYFHAIAHEYRGHMLDVVRHVSLSRPLVVPGDQPPTPPDMRLISVRSPDSLRATKAQPNARLFALWR